jgi:predicted Zn-dependent protease
MAARRYVKVVHHEIGHVLGVPHVLERGCLNWSHVER